MSEYTQDDELFRILAEVVTDYAIFIVDAKGNVQAWSKGAHQLLGYAEADILGESSARFYTAEDNERGVVQEELQRALSNGRSEDDRWHLRRDGSLFWASCVLTPLRGEDGKLRGFAKILRDRTDLKQQEEQMRRSDERKDAFLAILAHELRNALTPISTGLDILTLKVGGQDETVAMMKKQVEHLVRLVDDLLDVSRIERGKLELRKQPAQLSDLVDRAVNAVQASFSEKSHELTIALPEQELWLEVDPIRCVQMLENLLQNASKYTDCGGKIELAAERESDGICIRIRDNGIGITADRLPHVFELYAQSERAVERSQGGLGIGLKLVRSLARMHAGSIAAYSDGAGKGSEFVLRLPITKGTLQQDAPQPTRRDSSSRRILIVDDSVDAASLLASLLEMLDSHQVQTAHDGPAALERMDHFRPEIVLLDIGLPGMDGYGVAKQIRANRDYDRVLLVALTGLAQPEYRRKSEEAGFDMHLPKPVSVEQLRELLEHPKLVSSP
jgi:PAS domain S-box-containing protein